MPVAELELAFEVGAPEIVRRRPSRERCSGRAMARAARLLDQPVSVQHGVDGALGRDAHVPGQAADQEFADLACAPVRLLTLQAYDQALDLGRQLIGIAHRPTRAVGQGLEPELLVAGENLVAGLARDAEGAAELRHRLTVEKLCDKPQALVHHRTLLPRHPHLPLLGKSRRCNPCVRYELSPLSRAAHTPMPELRWPAASHCRKSSCASAL